jgi:hypothetical protein
MIGGMTGVIGSASDIIQSRQLQRRQPWLRRWYIYTLWLALGLPCACDITSCAGWDGNGTGTGYFDAVVTLHDGRRCGGAIEHKYGIVYDDMAVTGWRKCDDFANSREGLLDGKVGDWCKRDDLEFDSDDIADAE